MISAVPKFRPFTECDVNVSDECLRTVKNLIRLIVKYGIAAKSHFCHFDFQL